MWFINQVVIKKNHKDVLNSWSYIPGGGFSSPDISGIKEDIAIIQSTLEQKLSEGRSVSTELDKAKKEKKNLQQENLRLNHRIAYLEDQTTELQDGLKQVSWVMVMVVVANTPERPWRTDVEEHFWRRIGRRLRPTVKYSYKNRSSAYTVRWN